MSAEFWFGLGYGIALGALPCLIFMAGDAHRRVQDILAERQGKCGDCGLPAHGLLLCVQAADAVSKGGVKHMQRLAGTVTKC